MRTLSLDFEHKAGAATLGHGLLAVGALAAALVGGAQAMLSRDLARYATPASDAPAGGGPSKALPAGAIASETAALEGARAVVGHLSGPREKLFRTLETLDAPDVALLAIAPSSQKRTVRISGEARTFGAMLSYFSQLQQSRTFDDVVLVEHEILNDDPQRPLRFSLSARWGQ
ncbi:PilN domain-containing protein [Massilia glaciei]|uniref:Pilus assembly protein n=1 Tax=Massilia glaciei TaxID=1524097 RepID=A0A2U2HC26_9BURK|nr:PilN domain-containing protein [Massilia glaciei]PWF40451.1 pilus assembly protein [Massilia glaciei]